QAGIVADRLGQAIDFRTDIQKGLPLRVRGKVEAVAISPDGRWLAAGSAERLRAGVTIWDFTIGELVSFRWPRQGNDTVEVRSLAFSPDSKTLAVGCGNGVGIRLLDVATDREQMSLELGKTKSNVHALAYSPDGRWLAAGVDAVGNENGRGSLMIWD